MTYDLKGTLLLATMIAEIKRVEREWAWSDIVVDPVRRSETFTVVGFLDEAMTVLGVRHYGLVSHMKRGRIEHAIKAAGVREISRVEIIYAPACVEHDDCAACLEMGRACWAQRHYRWDAVPDKRMR